VSENEFFCVSCGGSTVQVFLPHTVDRDGKLIVIREVPMHECNGCGEVYMTTAVMKQLDEIVGQLLAGAAAQAIVNYRAA